MTGPGPSSSTAQRENGHREASAPDSVETVPAEPSPSEHDASEADPSGETASSDEVVPSDEQADFDETDIVVKANQLIRGRINWTKLEHRVVAMLVAQLKKEDDSFEMQQVHISELMDMAQVSSRDIYDRAEEICRKLLNQKVHVRTSTEDGRRMYQGYNCLSTCRYVEGSGYIEAKFNDDMKPFLLQLKRQFTMYRLQNFMQLSSQHSMRVYELIKMQEGLRHLCLSVEELREVLCCEHTYDRFSDFRRYVLERARTEIKDTCDTYYTYMVEREGRTPVRVRFLIHRQEEDIPPPPVSRAEDPGEGGTAPPDRGLDGSAAELPDSPLRAAEQRYNLYVSVLSRLPQEILDDISQSTVRSALRVGRAAVRPVDSEATPTDIADRMVRRTLEELEK